jgi:hypothetical protein
MLKGHAKVAAFLIRKSDADTTLKCKHGFEAHRSLALAFVFAPPPRPPAAAAPFSPPLQIIKMHSLASRYVPSTSKAIKGSHKDLINVLCDELKAVPHPDKFNPQRQYPCYYQVLKRRKVYVQMTKESRWETTHRRFSSFRSSHKHLYKLTFEKLHFISITA